MAVKILVVDDSVTMRKIMEMTFAAENAQVLAVDGADAALAKLDEFAPDLVFADVSMAPDCYDVARSVKSRRPNTAVVAVSSQHNPYDAAKGTAAGVDENVQKPFDTTMLINKVTEVLQRPRVQPAAAAAAAPKPAAAPAAAQAAIPLAAAPRDMKRTMAFGMPLVPVANPVGPMQGSPAAAPASPATPAADFATPAMAMPAVPKPSAPGPAPVIPAPKPAAAQAPAPAPTPAAAPAPAPAAASSAVAAATAGLPAKLGALGLTKEQVEGVLALSREVVEQVVWEVVPELAEALIKEEIRRLTAAG